MEAVEVPKCKICLEAITFESVVIDEVLCEILRILRINLNMVSVLVTNAICFGCHEKIQNAFLFKAKCLETEDSLMPYLNLNKKIKSLKLIMKDINKVEYSNLDDVEICRLCKNIVYGNIMINLKTVLEDIYMRKFFDRCFSEIKLEVIEECIICGHCQTSLSDFQQLLSSINDKEKRRDMLFKRKLRVKTATKNSRNEDSIVETSDYLNSKIQSKTITYIWKCKKCEYQSHIWKLFKGHMKTDHSEEIGAPFYKCWQCDFQVDHTARFKRHILTHNAKFIDTDVETFRCHLCTYFTKRKCALKDHMKVHNDETYRQKKCLYCTKKFKTNKTLNRHMICIHDHKAANNMMFKCEVCGYFTKRKDSLKRHMCKHKNQKQFFYCYQCKYKTDFKHSLQVHMIVHDKSEESKIFKCDYCSYVTNRKYTLQKHILTHKSHRVSPNFSCEECDYESKCKDFLRKHMITVHKNSIAVKLFYCNECSYTSKCHQHFRHHIKEKHSSEKKIKCPCCSYETSFSVRMTEHRKIHKEEK